MGYRYRIELDDFSIRDEDGRELETEISRGGTRFEAKWFYSAKNTLRTFHIHYRVRKGIFSYPDVSELYWRMIGEGWDKPTRRVTINVFLPDEVASREGLLVYGHGPLSGRAEIVDLKTARFTAENVQAHQFVEVRVAWPAGIVGGIPSNRLSRAAIQAEEAKYVRETIERAERAQNARARSRQRKRRLLVLWGLWLVIGPLFWLIFYVKAWKKVGRDYRFSDIPDYYREPPSDLPPALVEVLRREGALITPRSFTATLFDLARRGYLELQDRMVEKKRLFGTKQEVSTSITMRRSDAGKSLLPYEQEILQLLFVTVGERSLEKGSRIELDDLKSYLEKKPQKFQTWFKEWSQKIKKEALEKEFIEPASIKKRNLFLAITWPLAILTANIILIVFAAVFIPKIKRRARPWARENEHWKALDRFLDDFSSFKDLPPEAYKLWEHYLVFGILFGNAKKIIKMLPIILKDERSVVPVWYYGYQHAAFIETGGINSMIKSIDSMSSSIQSASTSAAHYSSGSGGGFSGGGGGGGGGSAG